MERRRKDYSTMGGVKKPSRQWVYCTLFLMVLSVSLAVALVIVVMATGGKPMPCIPPDSILPSPIKWSRPSASFAVICLGSGGGPSSGDTSAYMVGIIESSAPFPTTMMLFDGGSLINGLQYADFNTVFASLRPPIGLSRVGFVMRNVIKHYFISHGHLDHFSGWVTGTPVDEPGKNVYGLASTLSVLKDHVFNNVVWANFGNEGQDPLNQFTYKSMQPHSPAHPEGVAIPDMHVPTNVSAFVLDHNGDDSTAFLISSNNKHMVYFGDVGPDSVQKTNATLRVWEAVAPLVKRGDFAGIIIECSYPDGRDPAQLFGHLTPKYLMEELTVLAKLVDADNYRTALKNMVVMVTHIKDEFVGDARDEITVELERQNNLGVIILYPTQGFQYNI